MKFVHSLLFGAAATSQAAAEVDFSSLKAQFISDMDSKFDQWVKDNQAKFDQPPAPVHTDLDEALERVQELLASEDAIKKSLPGLPADKIGGAEKFDFTFSNGAAGLNVLDHDGNSVYSKTFGEPTQEPTPVTDAPAT